MSRTAKCHVVRAMIVVLAAIAQTGILRADNTGLRPMRPLPRAMSGVEAKERVHFVDPVAGDDKSVGDKAKPWRTLTHATAQLAPGDTLYLRGGVYYEKFAPTRSGLEGRPITIASYPGELAVIDGGLREFFESPGASWTPNPDGAPGEFVSTRTYPNADARRAPVQFLPAAWEPMWGIEEERPLALGHFANSMTPLHSYRLAIDLRDDNELWLSSKREKEKGIYCGPGLWFNRATNRIHVRLAHHRLEGLGERAYRGETDPRKVAMHIAVGFGDEILRIVGIKHLRLQGLVFRGATGSPLIHIYGSQSITLDHVTGYGGFPGLLINASQQIQVTHSAFRGLAAPWTSRAHMKYRGTASYQIVLRNDQPRNEDIEFSNCEFTDDHDFAFLQPVSNLQFHHNYVDNFNDDGLECGPKIRDHTIFIHHNRIGRCLIPITQHEILKDESPTDHDEGSGVYVYRNVFDMRGGVYSAPPREPDPTGAYLRREGHLVGDHGSPVWPVMRVYHNTFLRDTPVFRNYFLFGLGAQALRDTERDVFNNIFVQSDAIPGVGFAGIKQPGNAREGGNLIWGFGGGQTDPFAKFRASPLFEASKLRYEAGYTSDDVAADPKFVRFGEGEDDLRLTAKSPAVNAGIELPASWPDDDRSEDRGKPDAGVLPIGKQPWGVGVNGRVPLY